MLVHGGKGRISTLKGLLDVSHEVDHRYHTCCFSDIVAIKFKGVLLVLQYQSLHPRVEQIHYVIIRLCSIVMKKGRNVVGENAQRKLRMVLDELILIELIEKQVG